ncbi:NADH-quinone oxidoreductase subunit F/NADP-reducing hydrogenase subunit HndC [Hypnocyclicus thermotrophus]|uniref:NADH-quinone oxidoreductase subunit F/NADP-reducing hydrogenase subunit HndC n=1 Tax=Hypnocyclicus thermotrophus TaxID=1627895 RepID=A0AA46I4U4_9FUSO|nr:NADH-quinone oxidoreductase subunit NuoF [Hypnocyclicus thermotrophus]TDT67427.1 NADH-quinone oxidoreductase subunit F/NADP-reducing hydrogenase subunit HndC [Hypnocyclicus thermotrophus]
MLKTIEDLKQIKNKFLEKNNEKIQIKVSMATCGITAGADSIYEYFKDEIDRINNNKIVLISTGCMGLCHSEPTIEVTLPGQKPEIYGNVDVKKAENIFKDILYKKVKESDIIISSKQKKIVLRNCGFMDPENIDDAISKDAYFALNKVLTNMSQEEVINEIKKSGLRGRGGGGFPTGLKWEFAYKNKANKKYVVCNADEGDPGAFMDRSVLEGDPHSVLEAMAICGYAIGSDEGIIYIRAEYPLAIERLKIAIKQAEDYGLLGENIFGTNFKFKITLKYGAGAFVCGEETALIHSMEGKRGEPTLKPPFPAEAGYWEKPTNVNNVETYANITAIINKGSDWFRSIGTEKSPGTKVFALAGKVKNVGLIEVPMGTTLRDVIFDIGGGIVGNKAFKAVQTGGPSGGCLTKNELDTPIDFDTLKEQGSMMGSGGMIVMDENDCMVAVAKFYLGFTVDESCGKCTPCRIGNKRLYEILEKITDGKGTLNDLDLLKDLSNTIKRASLCGLGKTAPNPVLSTLDKFYDEYEAHVKDKKCPATVCTNLIKFTITDKCIGCTMCAKVCPTDAILGRVKEKHYIYQERCIKCGSCYNACRFNAIKKA